jgi:hypothetical protein
MRKKDCFAYTDIGCKALTNGKCVKCKFYKTKAKNDSDLRKSQEYLEEKYGVPYSLYAKAKGLIK